MNTQDTTGYAEVGSAGAQSARLSAIAGIEEGIKEKKRSLREQMTVCALQGIPTEPAMLGYGGYDALMGLAEDNLQLCREYAALGCMTLLNSSINNVFSNLYKAMYFLNSVDCLSNKRASDVLDGIDNFVELHKTQLGPSEYDACHDAIGIIRGYVPQRPPTVKLEDLMKLDELMMQAPAKPSSL